MADPNTIIEIKDNSQDGDVVLIEDSITPNVPEVDTASCVDLSIDDPTLPSNESPKLPNPENGIDIESIPDANSTSEVDVQTISDEEPIKISNENTMPVAMEKPDLPFITITFSDRELFNLHNEQFKTFLNMIGNYKIFQKDCCLKVGPSDYVCSPDWVTAEIEDSISADIEDLDIENSKKRKRRKQKSIDVDEDDLFVVDTEPSIDIAHSPIYKSKYKLMNDDDENSGECEKERHSAVKCFNCSGEHNLKDCPRPKDMQRIKAAKQKMMKPARYHQDEDNKFSHLKPGVMSDKLRRAMGLRRGEIPIHIYKMRTMGYPPGWLAEAKVTTSNIALFGVDGNEDTSLTQNCSIDPEKIIDYPGFNCKCERGSKDEYKYYNVPQYSTALSKENMIEFLNKQLNDDADVKQLKKVIDVDERIKADSPTLIDLEAQKKILLEQLTTNEDSNTSANQSVEMNQTTEQTEALTAATETPMKTTPTTIVKSSVMGTPILKSLSPYGHLPNSDNFSKDVSPVIYFENLPNATGKYEQMTAVLSKVRNTLKTRHSL